MEHLSGFNKSAAFGFNETCSNVWNVEQETRCQFVKGTKDCHVEEGFISYTTFVHCSAVLEGTVFLCFLWLLFLFVGLSTAAEKFLCPSLVAISKLLRLSENVAGVTLVAFGNGAPDIISAVAAVRQGRMALVTGQIFGGGIFVTCVIVGVIFIQSNFKLKEGPFLRDVVFYLFASFWVFILFRQGSLDMSHAVGFIVFYLVYLFVVFFGRFIHQRYGEVFRPAIRFVSPVDDDINLTTPRTSPLLIEASSSSSRSRASSINVQRKDSTVAKPKPKVISDETDSSDGIQNGIFSISSTLNDLENDGESFVMFEDSVLEFHTDTDPLVDPHYGSWTETLYVVLPFLADNWKKQTWFSKAFMVVRFPAHLLFTLTVPVVDHERSNHNWNKILYSLHCTTGPLAICIITGGSSVYIDDKFPLWALILLIGMSVSTLVWFTSSRYQQPVYQPAFSVLAVVVVMVWIYIVITEVITILKTIGIVFRISDVVLGVTLLAWGNNVGDFMTNVSIARRGYGRMALSGCFGTPLLILLMGLGISCTSYLATVSKTIVIEYTIAVTVLYSTLTFSLVSSLFVMLALWFRSNRWYGFYLLAVYVIFLVIMLLLELKVIK